MDLAVPAFCARYPYATLILYRNFNTNTVAELVELLMAFDCQCPELGIWLRSIPKRVLEKTRAAVSPYGGGKPVG